VDFKTGLEGKPWWHGLVAGVAAGGVFFGLLFWLKLGPMGDELERLRGDLAAKQQEILKGRAAQQQLPRFREEVQALERELDKLLSILPTRRKTADLLRRIRSLAEEGNLTLKRFTPSPLAEKDFYSEFPIEVEVDGTYHSLALFFDEIGRYSRIVNIEKLEIEALQSKGVQTIHSSFIAKSFVSKPVEPPAEGEGTEGGQAAVATAGGPAAAEGGSPLTSAPPGGES
jgi:type IV pilus assembly protein PilO